LGFTIYARVGVRESRALGKLDLRGKRRDAKPMIGTIREFSRIKKCRMAEHFRRPFRTGLFLGRYQTPRVWLLSDVPTALNVSANTIEMAALCRDAATELDKRARAGVGISAKGSLMPTTARGWAGRLSAAGTRIP
jgi:hypothetical protein